MELKLDENSKEYKNFISALDNVNKKILDISAKIQNAETLSEQNSYSEELKTLLKNREEICEYSQDIIAKYID